MPSRRTSALPNWIVVALVGHLALDQAVGLLVLEEEDRVRVLDRLDQHPLARRTGVDGATTFRPGHVREERLDRLRVIQRSVHAAAVWGADHQRHAEVTVRAVPDARRLLNDLVEGREDEVGELHLGDGEQAVDRHPDRRRRRSDISSSGVSSTRSSPNSSRKPIVARNTPPRAPTSSPRTTMRSSRRISSCERVVDRLNSVLLGHHTTSMSP